MANPLVDQVLTIPAGVNHQVVPIPKNVKQPDEALQIEVLMDAAPFPTGSTNIVLEFSEDGGGTYPPERSFNAGDFVRPPAPRLGSFEEFSFAMDPGFDPTHVRVTTNAPSQFSTRTIVNAFSITALMVV